MENTYLNMFDAADVTDTVLAIFNSIAATKILKRSLSELSLFLSCSTISLSLSVQVLAVSLSL
jgi:hypothetical protein